MQTNPFRGRVGGGWGQEIETFLGPLKWPEKRGRKRETWSPPRDHFPAWLNVQKMVSLQGSRDFSGMGEGKQATSRTSGCNRMMQRRQQQYGQQQQGQQQQGQKQHGRQYSMHISNSKDARNSKEANKWRCWHIFLTNLICHLSCAQFFFRNNARKVRWPENLRGKL